MAERAMKFAATELRYLDVRSADRLMETFKAVEITGID
jgi:hypothetical protein